MPTRTFIGHLFVTSLLLLFLSVLTGLLWLVLFALKVPFAAVMAGLAITFVVAWLLTFVATIYLDLFTRLNED